MVLEGESSRHQSDTFAAQSVVDMRAAVIRGNNSATSIMIGARVARVDCTSEVKGFWVTRFTDLKTQGFGRTERTDANIKMLSGCTATAICFGRIRPGQMYKAD